MLRFIRAQSFHDIRNATGDKSLFLLSYDDDLVRLVLLLSSNCCLNTSGTPSHDNHISFFILSLLNLSLAPPCEQNVPTHSGTIFVCQAIA